MPSLILHPPLHRLQFLALDLPGLLDLFRHPPVPGYPAYLRHMLIPLLQRVVVLQLLPLSRALDARAGVRLGAPQTHIAVVAAREDVVRVRSEAGAEDALHALRVVDVARMAAGAVGPQADGAVIRCGDEVLAGWGEGDVHDGGDMVFEDVEGAGHFADVEDVDVVVFVCNSKVEGFHWVPGKGVGSKGEGSFEEGGGGAQVVKDEGAVRGTGGEDGGFSLIKCEGCYGVS